MSPSQNPYRQLQKQAIALHDFTAATKALSEALRALTYAGFSSDAFKSACGGDFEEPIYGDDVTLDLVTYLEACEGLTQNLEEDLEQRFKDLTGDLDEEC